MITPEDYLSPALPVLQLTSIPVFCPRCSPGPPGLPPLDIDPPQEGQPTLILVEPLSPFAAPPFIALPEFLLPCHEPECSGIAIVRV